eukprot:COSAG02_NODE_51996_length_310_cov_1.260664_1_plen_23_part_01
MLISVMICEKQHRLEVAGGCNVF